MWWQPYSDVISQRCTSFISFEAEAMSIRNFESASKEPNVTLQVVPFEAGAHPGVLGSFVIMEFPVRNDVDVVYTEALTSSLYLERDDDVSAYDRAFDRLRAAALDVGPSRRLVTQIAKELE